MKLLNNPPFNDLIKEVEEEISEEDISEEDISEEDISEELL